MRVRRRGRVEESDRERGRGGGGSEKGGREGEEEGGRVIGRRREGSSLGPRPSPLRDLLRAFNCTARGRETLKTGKAWDETSRAHRRAGSRAPRCLDRKYVYTCERSTAKLRLTSSAVKAYTYAYHTCVKRSRVYTFIHSCGRGNGARATRRLPNVYGHMMFHPRPSPFSMFPSPGLYN